MSHEITNINMKETQLKSDENVMSVDMESLEFCSWIRGKLQGTPR